MAEASRTIRDLHGQAVTPEVVLIAYRELRCFPMCAARDQPIGWYRPQRRAILTWDRYRVPRSLAKVLRNRRPYRITVDRAFAAVIAACAERPETWIGRDIEALYTELHRLGHAHSVEAWDGEGRLVGGLYGLSVGGCFCGESMFHRADDASKACVVHLVGLLQSLGYSLLDCQQQTAHMARFGAYEVDDRTYAALLATAPPPRPWPS